MKDRYAAHAPRSLGALIILLCTLSAGGTAFAQSQVETIIQRSVEANNRDWKADPEYSYFERDAQNGVTRTNQVMMIEGSPYYRLVAINDKPISKEEQAKEEHKLQQAIAQRKSESPRQRAARIAQHEKDRKRNHLMMEQLTKAFNFTLEGEQKLGTNEVYVLKATPRPGYVPPNRETRVLTGMEGKLWIDKQTYQWVKVEAQVVHPVSIEGFLARVEPGTRFELEKMPVSDGVWLPRHFAMQAHAKVLGLFSHNQQEEDTYWGYQKGAPPAEATQQSFNDGKQLK
ncbi:MAG: hypothetical protein WA188_22030 [Terriglobales bacterium]